MHRTLRYALLATAALTQACASCDKVPAGAVTSCEQSPPVPQGVKTDFLFVVDDSGSMREEQENLQANLSKFIAALNDSPVANDFQVGVTTTSVSGWSSATPTGESGALVGPAGSRVLVGGTASFVTDFEARVVVGTGGSGKEQGLQAMRKALSTAFLDPPGANEGLIRPGARLAVVFLSDEDDCSDSASPWVDSNDKCHNYAATGNKDFKHTDMDPLADFVTLLEQPIGPTGAQEVKEVVLGAIVGVDPTYLLPTCDFDDTMADPNGWCCGSADYTCPSTDPAVCGSYSATILGVPGEVYCCNATSGDTCSTTCPNAYDKADRYSELLAAWEATHPRHTLTASICDASFETTLTRIACMLVPQDVTLDSKPADWRMMLVTLSGGGTTTPCHVVMEGAADEATADVVIHEPPGGSPFLHFQNACELGCGKRISLDLICAG